MESKSFFVIVKDCKKQIENFWRDSHNKEAKESFGILYGLLWPQIEHLPEKNKITSFFIPIASSAIFYGNIFVCVPNFSYDTEEDKQKIKELASKLHKCIQDHYVPALALIHEHFFEKLVAPKIKEVIATDITEEDKQKEIIKLLMKTTEDARSFICRRSKDREKPCWSCPHFGWEESSDNVVEKYLHKLWQDRKTIRESEYIYGSLFFKDRLYTAPKMLDALENFLKPSKAKIKKDGKMPSVLVEADTGAGKDVIPKLLRLFSNCYNRGEYIILNMASLKPDAFVPAAMVGGEIKWEEGVCEKNYWQETYRLKGIFREIRKEVLDEFKKFVEEKGSLGLSGKAEKYITSLGTCIGKIENYISKIEKKVQGFTKAKRPKTRRGEIQNRRSNIASEGARHKELKTKLKEEKEVVEGLVGELKKGFDLKKLDSKEKLIVKKLFGKFPTVVLDELNSLNIESQGVLLRFLEQAEITPIGGYKDVMPADDKNDKEYREFITDFFVVGLMNEDPEVITREEATRFLKKQKYIGGLLGDLLYEHIIRIRRLRPDLRARMMRNGKFKIPKLAERRADIPHSFYSLISDAKSDYFIINSEIKITMDALEYLMRPEFEWHENFRLLETLCKKVMETVYEYYKNKRDPILTVDEKKNDEKKLIIVQRKHVEEAMKEIGMIKESEKAKE